ncbi:MAG: hypothetical protein BWY21_01741 [Parcubacteria group bacterium ADurb.Bin216]|nr:MAG: hypothetical protein BWY21_01741 [Parcubacteria group bacterium ADurb.Bin216]
MAQSSEIYSQIQSLLGQVNPMLEQLPSAEQYYKDATNKAFNYNLGPLQNAAQLESKMYSMPGNLMSQYDTEFGGKTGISSNQRINSILSQLGNQAGVVDVARGLADQSGTRINDLAKTLLGQYQTGIQAKQQQLSPLMSIWDRMFAEEQANSRAARAGSGGSGYTSKFGDIEIIDDETPDTPDTPTTDAPGATTKTNPTTGQKILQTGALFNNIAGTLIPGYTNTVNATVKKVAPVVKTVSNLYDQYQGIKNNVTGLVNTFKSIWD